MSSVQLSLSHVIKAHSEGTPTHSHTHTQKRGKKNHFPLCIISPTCKMQNHGIHNGLDSFQLMVVWQERTEGDVLQIHSASHPCAERVSGEFINGIFNCYLSLPRHSQICRWSSTVALYCLKLCPCLIQLIVASRVFVWQSDTVNDELWQQGNPAGLQRWLESLQSLIFSFGHHVCWIYYRPACNWITPSRQYVDILTSFFLRADANIDTVIDYK